MKVDFNQDEFGEIWLMHARELYVRKRRHVPDNHGTQLADYIFNHMQEINKHEEKKKM